ncbi:Tn7-like element transposition protein TnsE [Vibrio sp. Isolate31]|nr:Tn7-like element transposition protein TnsE [Vibrio sp. Isolate32]MCG9603197.1 Tn7-like element transposition protein TnsE [Vibrio sp. Isolate31]
MVTKSLGWPTQEMDAMFGFKKHIGIFHPKSVEGHPTSIPTESILDWARRVIEKLKIDAPNHLRQWVVIINFSFAALFSDN